MCGRLFKYQHHRLLILHAIAIAIANSWPRIALLIAQSFFFRAKVGMYDRDRNALPVQQHCMRTNPILRRSSIYSKPISDASMHDDRMLVW